MNLIRKSRITETLPRQLFNIEALEKEWRWVKWWIEVETPTLCPTVLVRDVLITRAAGAT